jgi:hypothetical protein
MLFIILWAMAAALFFFVVEPRVPIVLGIAGGGCGAIAGLMQHLSLTQARDKFAAASSLLEVRRAIENTSWGSRYILWLYSCKIALIILAVLIIRKPLLQIAFGYLAAYASLMLVRELVTLRDTIAIKSGTTSPQ